MPMSGRRFFTLATLAILLGSQTVAPALAAPRNVAFDPDIEIMGLADYQHEVSIAYNPANPANLAVTIQDSTVLSSGNTTAVCHAGYTVDGGTSWSLGAGAPYQFQ